MKINVTSNTIQDNQKLVKLNAHVDMRDMFHTIGFGFRSGLSKLNWSQGRKFKVMCSGPHTHLECKENSPSPPTSDPLNCKQIPSRNKQCPLR